MAQHCPVCGNPVTADVSNQQAPPPVDAAASTPGAVAPPPPANAAPPPPVDAAPPPPVEAAPSPRVEPAPLPPVRGATVPRATGNRNAVVAAVVVASAALAALGVVVLTGGNDADSEQSGAETTEASPEVPMTTVPAEVVIDEEIAVEDAFEEDVFDAVEEIVIPETVRPPQTIPDPGVLPEPPAIFTPPVISSVSATAVRSSSTDACGNPTFYDPFQIADGRRDTAWMAPGNAIGQSVIFDLVQPSRVYEVGLIPGYDKIDPCASDSDRFFDLRRITSVRWTFDNGFEVVQQTRPSRELQTLSLGEGVVTSRVIMTVTGTLPPGLERLDHTPISEVVIR